MARKTRIIDHLREAAELEAPRVKASDEKIPDEEGRKEE